MKRYEFAECNHHVCWCSIKESVVGKYVLYSDVEALREENERLKNALKRIAYDTHVHCLGDRMKFINIAKSALERKPA